MKRNLFMFVLFGIFFVIRPAWSSCLIVDDENAKKTAEKAYFIGMVRGDYIHQTAGGFLKEVGMTPILAYKADPSLKFNELIVISNETPKKTSCDAPVPSRGQLMEVLIVKMDGRLKMLRLGNLQTRKKDELLDELRGQARYVGAN
ncbi:MAG: hypothetical protein KDI65_10320 [Alphaproteobacteria bacterium]|nr:hypothetical protein [Alphaproteobacteria bacterium]